MDMAHLADVVHNLLEEAMVLCNGVGDVAVREQGRLHVHDVLRRYLFD